MVLPFSSYFSLLLISTFLLLSQPWQLAFAICENGVSTTLAGQGSSTYNTITYCPLNIPSGADANIFPVTTSCTNGAIPDWSFELQDVTPSSPSKYTWGYIYDKDYLMIGEDVSGVQPPYAWVDSDLTIKLAHIAIHCSTWTSGMPPCEANVKLVLACPLVSTFEGGPTAPSGEPAWSCVNYPEQCTALGIPIATPTPAPTPKASSDPSSTPPPTDNTATEAPVLSPPPPGGGVSTYFNYTQQMGGRDASSSGSSSSKKKTSIWLIIGPVVGGVVLLLILEETIRYSWNRHLEKKRVAAEEVLAASAPPPPAQSVGAAGAHSHPPGLRSRSASQVEKGAYKPAG
jgi:hypothetical protein